MDESPVQAPVPGAAPAPDFPEVTPQQAQQATAAPHDLSSRAAELEDELAKIRAEMLAGAKTLLRVLRPHVSFTHGGITVGNDPTPVPERAVGALMTAAADAGVTIKEAEV
jgi:hypothetical protein